jgi:N-acetylglucosamine kinase-like BadF-type ATPase
MKYVMSLDGGGSKLLCLIADQNGNLVGKGRGGPTNANFSEAEDVEKSLMAGISQALGQSKVNSCDVLSVNSAIISYGREWLIQVIGKLFCQQTGIHSHAEFTLSLFGAIQQEYGALVQSGTGSFAAVCTEKGCSVAGGKGCVAGDEGSGFYIGSKALIACARMDDGLGPVTMLMERLLDFMKVKHLWDILSELNRAPIDKQRATIASFCPLVGTCAGEGDEVAVNILQRAGRHLAKLILSTFKKAGIHDELPITVSGGAWKTSPLLFRSFSEHVRNELPSVRILPPMFEPSAGGILLGLRDIGFPVMYRLDELQIKLTEFVYPKKLFL